MTKKLLMISFAVVTIILCVAGMICFIAKSFFSKPENIRECVYRNKSVDILLAHLARMEKPDAKSVYLADVQAEEYRKYFENAGLYCASNGAQGCYKLMFLAGKPPKAWDKILEKLSPDGVLALVVDSRKLTAFPFKTILTSFPCESVKIWMPSENDWLLTGRLKDCRLRLDVLLDAFSPDGSVEDLTYAQCDSLPELYANFVGTREDVLPALENVEDLPVRAECFIPREIPSFDMLERGDVEDDIWKKVKQDLRSFQVVRRLVAEGNLLAMKKDGIDAAIEKWSAADTRNPHDSMLLDRLHRLAVNARAFEKIGNLKGAAKCYETMASVRPKDVASLRSYAECMRRLGQKDVANAAFRRVKELEK